MVHSPMNPSTSNASRTRGSRDSRTTCISRDTISTRSATTCTGPLDGYAPSHKAPSKTPPTAGRPTARSARPRDPGRMGLAKALLPQGFRRSVQSLDELGHRPATRHAPKSNPLRATQSPSQTSPLAKSRSLSGAAASRNTPSSPAHTVQTATSSISGRSGRCSKVSFGSPGPTSVDH